MAGGVNAAAALADLLEVSDRLRGAVILGGDGAVLAADGAVDAGAGAVLTAADEAARLLGRPPVHQCDVRLPDARVLAVREGGCAAVAVADPDATAGLVLYDLREALRGLAAEEA